MAKFVLGFLWQRDLHDLLSVVMHEIVVRPTCLSISGA